MLTDPTLDRIREARRQISEKCNHDPKRLIAYYQELQSQYADRLIRSPQPPAEKKTE